MGEVHGHLCDSINTPLVVARLQALAKNAVAYIAKGGARAPTRRCSGASRPASPGS